MKKLMIAVTFFAAGVAVGRLFAPECVKIERRRVVLIERDTIVERQPPVLVERPVGPEVEVTGRLTEGDDTATVSVAKVQREFGDSRYRVWVSGVEPMLDSIAIYREEVVAEVPVVVKPTSRWGVAVGAGVALTPAGRLQPALTIGVCYRLWPK